MKRYINIFISSLLLISVLACKRQAINNTATMPEKFFVFNGKLADGRPAVGSFNAAYKNYGLKPKYPWCLKINVALKLKNITPNGLPLKVESDTANKFEDYLIANIRKITTTHYIGHIYNDSFLDVYVYVEEPEKVNQFLKSETAKKNIIRPFAYEMKEDINWETVADFLK